MTSKSGLTNWLAPLTDACQVLAYETRRLLRFEFTSSVLVVVFLALFLPTLGRYAENAPMLASFSEDEPLITMQIDGMTAWPYGNPANYLDTYLVKKEVPSHWYNIRYTNIPYYGGLYPGMAAAIWMPLKLVGLPLFPTVPIILRTLALLFSVCTLLALYNFSRDHLGRFSALVGSISLASTYHFVFIGTMAHPDSLLFFLGFLSLALCVRHAKEGSVSSLIAIGIIAGLAQGAKMGGPWLIPLTVTSVVLGIRSKTVLSKTFTKYLQLLIKRGVCVASVAIIVFLITTPYAILDRYYLDTWQIWAKSFSGEREVASLSNFRDWTEAFVNDVGTSLLVACGAAILIRLVFWRRFRDGVPWLLYGILALTVFFWYAALQKYWVQLQYLVLTMSFVGVMAGSLIDIALGPLLARSSHRSVNMIAGLLVTLAFLVFTQSNIFRSVLVPIQYAEWRSSPQLLPGTWIKQHLPSADGKVFFDSQVYFDPVQFPDQLSNSGPIKYIDLAKELPTYFALTYYPGSWMRQKMSSQHLTPWDNEYFSMRLYQDLLGRDPIGLTADGYNKLLAEKVPGVSRLMGFGSADPSVTNSCFAETSHSMSSMAKWRCASRVLCGGACGYTGVNMGRAVYLFSLDASKFLSYVPENIRYSSALAFASSSVKGYAPSGILGETGQAWLADKSGVAAEGEFVGIDFGLKPIQPKLLLIKWVAYRWLPRSIAVEYSDDRQKWERMASLEVSQPTDPAVRLAQGTMRWEERFHLPTGAVGAHRYWRVVALDVPDEHLFGMEKLRFLISEND